MSRPTTKPELRSRVESDFAALLQTIQALEPAQQLEPGCCDEWSVKDVLAHLDAWHELFLEWERVGSAGGRPAMPAEGYTWKDTPALNETIWQRTQHDDLDTVLTRLGNSHRRVLARIDSYPEQELFTKGRYSWTGSTSVGSYAVSATTSHYDWARTLVRRFARRQA